MINIELLQLVCPKTKKTTLLKYIEPLNDVCSYYDIFENKNRTAAFIAQLAHESGCFTTIIENLNYSAKGLMTTFKKYFPNETIARQYERQPEKIANYVYANRMKNGPEISGDGFKFRGRGLIQLTGRDNYTQFSEGLDISLDETITYLETPAGATSVSGWYWDKNNLNAYCDSGDFIQLTKKINGGINGLTDRLQKYEIALQHIG